MPAVRAAQIERTDDVVALARAGAGPIEAFDTAAAALETREKELVLRALARAVRRADERVAALEEVSAALRGLAEVAAYRAVVLDVELDPARVHLALLGQQVRLVAGVLPALDPRTLACGDEVEVVLTGPQHYGVRRRIGPHRRWGTVGRLEEVLAAGQLRVARGPDTLVLRSTPALAAELDDEREVVGRLVAYDEGLGLAFGFFGEPERAELVLREVPAVQRHELVLPPATLRFLDEAVLLPLRHPAEARAAGVVPVRFLLMVGPPGVGKTACCRWLATELGRPVYLVSGSELASKWYGETEERLRRRIRAAQAEPDGAVLVWDEAESLLVERGRSQVGVEGRVLSVLLTATDGFTRPGEVLFVLTTNRPDQIDSALLRPLRAVTVTFERPGPAETRELFALHLDRTSPDAGDVADLARTGAAAVFGVRETLGTAVLRDGTRLPLGRPMAVSGALVRASCERARRFAFIRRVRRNGDLPSGLRTEDLVTAVDEEFAALARTLTPASVGSALTLPRGVAAEIVALEFEPGIARHRFVGGPLT